VLIRVIIKLLAGLNLFLGILLRKRVPGYKFSEIKSILIKRTDRIGDAAVTLPILLELGKHFQVRVLTSKYNDAFLNKFLSTEISCDAPRNLLGSLILIIRSIPLLFAGPKKNVPKYDLFLDLNGLRDPAVFFRVKRENLCRYYAGFNMGLWNPMFDYAQPNYPVLFSQTHILDACRSLVSNALGCNMDIPDGIDFSGKMIRPDDFQVKEEFILVNISGGEQFRGPSPKFYARLVDSLDFTGSIVIMDALNRPHFADFKSSVKRKDIMYLQRDFSLWELLYIAAKSSLYVGADSGISNLLQFPANAILFFATGLPWVWRPYSRNPYTVRKIGRCLVAETVNSGGLNKKVVYAPVSCRPCFDIGCQDARCIESLDLELALNEINAMLLKG